MPGQDDEAKASQIIRSLLKYGMYWLYDNNGKPVVRMRDSKSWQDVQNNFKTLPQYAGHTAVTDSMHHRS